MLSLKGAGPQVKLRLADLWDAVVYLVDGGHILGEKPFRFSVNPAVVPVTSTIGKPFCPGLLERLAVAVELSHAERDSVLAEERRNRESGTSESFQPFYDLLLALRHC